MRENKVFLKYLIDEEIYIIEDKPTLDPGVNLGVADDENIRKSPGQESNQMLDVKMKTKTAAGTDKKGDENKSVDVEDTAGVNKSVDVKDTDGTSRSVDVEDTAGVSRSVDVKDSAGAKKSATNEETAEVSKSMDLDHSMEADRVVDKEPTAGKSSSVAEDDTADAGSSLVKADTTGAGRVLDKEPTAGESSSVEGDDTADLSSSGYDKPTKRYKDTTVILLDYNDKTSMSREHIDLLARILQSVNLNLDSVEMVFRTEFDKLGVKSFINCTVIAFLPLVAGPISALFESEKYAINIISKNQFVVCDPLNDLNQNRSLKRKLWERLKLIYGI